MARCAICKKPVISGLVVDGECLDEMKDRLAKLAKYEQAEAEGRLVMLPYPIPHGMRVCLEPAVDMPKIFVNKEGAE